VPSRNAWRWSAYVDNRDRIEPLRATAAAAAQHGVFRLNDRQTAAETVAVILLPAFDPGLCLHAAYAFADADFRDDIAAVQTAMEQGMGARSFDVAMLARTLRPGSVRPSETDALPIVPFCPLLTQGRNLLRARRIELPGRLNDAQDDLEPALWTTFKPIRTQMIIEAIRRGELTCDLDAALRILRDEALPILEWLGDIRARATVMGRVAQILLQKEDAGAARILQEERLEIHRRLADAMASRPTKSCSSSAAQTSLP
jgi:hypothetical protein